jgi:hypothetical protein
MVDQPKISEEIKKMEYEPLLPAEKKMIIINLVLGVFLMVVLMWVSRTYFPPEQIKAAPVDAATTGSAAPVQGK